MTIVLQRKSVEAESDALREEYLQRVATLERKVRILLTVLSLILLGMKMWPCLNSVD